MRALVQLGVTEHERRERVHLVGIDRWMVGDRTKRGALRNLSTLAATSDESSGAIASAPPLRAALGPGPWAKIYEWKNPPSNFT